MLPILQFVFSSFWVWLGSAVMLLIISETVGGVFGALLSVIRGRLK